MIVPMKGIHWVVHPPSMPVANGCFQKLWYPKLDGENNGSKPYEQMDDLGGFPPLFLVQHPNEVFFSGSPSPKNLKTLVVTSQHPF